MITGGAPVSSVPVSSALGGGSSPDITLALTGVAASGAIGRLTASGGVLTTERVEVVNGVLSATLGGTTDFTVSGFGTPTAAVIVWNNAQISTNPNPNAIIGVGFWDGTSQRAVGMLDADNVTTTAATGSSDDSYGITIPSTTIGVDTADYSISPITDGIRLTLAVDNTGIQRWATVTLFSGLSARAITFTPNPVQDGTQESSSIGFPPKFAYFSTIAGGTTADQVSAAGATISFGFAEIGGAHRAATFSALTGAPDATNNVLFSETRCINDILNNVQNWGLEVTTWGSDTFIGTTRDAATGGHLAFALVLGGNTSYDCGTLTSPTADGNQTIATNVTPQALMTAFTTAPDSALRTSSPTADGIAFGMADDPTNQFIHLISVTDGAAITDTSSVFSTAFVAGCASQTLTSSDLDNGAGLSAFNTNDLVLAWAIDGTSSTPCKGWWIAWGPPAIALALSGVNGTGSPGTLVPLLSLPLSGVAAAGAVGNALVTFTLPLSGVLGTGAVGDLAPELIITGVAGTGSAGLLEPGMLIGLTGVGAAGSVGTLMPEAVGVILTGVAATGSAGTLVPGITKAISGVLASGSPGTLFAGGAVAGITIDSPIILTPLILDAVMQSPVLGVALATSLKVEAGGYIASDNSVGIDASITTGSLVGKTITVKDGIIVGFS